MKLSFRTKVTIIALIPLIYLEGLTIYPFLSVIFYSFQKWDIGTPMVFGGFNNFIQLFQDQSFYKALWLTGSYTVLAVASEFALGIGIAYLLVHIKHGRSLATSILILPLVMTPAVVGIIFRIMYDPAFGHINFYLSLLGIPPVKWLIRPTEAFISCVIVDIWQWTPFVTLVTFAGLTSIPVELVESAYIDGASEFSTFKDILLPRIKALLYIILLLRVIDALKIFDTVYTMTGGGPGSSTYMLAIFNYLNLMTFYHVGYGCAIAGFYIVMMNIVVNRLQKLTGGALYEVAAV
jgi:multiple sugar transport system permease protein